MSDLRARLISLADNASCDPPNDGLLRDFIVFEAARITLEEVLRGGETGQQTWRTQRARIRRLADELKQIL